LPDFVEIWYAAAAWVSEVGLLIEVKNDWLDGRSQMTMQL